MPMIARLALVLLLASSVCAASEDDRLDLVRLEQQLTEALVRSDAETIEPLWADELVWIGLNGKAVSKAQRLAGMRAAAAAPSSLRATNTSVDIKLYGDTSLVTVMSTWTTRVDDKEVRSDYIATHVWNKRGAKWQLVAAHISKVE